MEKNELKDILNNVLRPFGFKRKSNYWIQDSKEIAKVVHLQKSQFDNRFYVNYGYIIKALPLNGLTMHVFKGLDSENPNDRASIKELLNLNNEIPEESRVAGLKKFIDAIIISKFDKVKSEVDILSELKSYEKPNIVPLQVKKYLADLEKPD